MTFVLGLVLIVGGCALIACYGAACYILASRARHDRKARYQEHLKRQRDREKLGR